MRTRLELHEILSGIPGVVGCYYSPPETLRMERPCIVYNWDNDESLYADNLLFFKRRRYSVTVIDEDPDSEIPDRVSELSYCTSERNYVHDGFYHFVYTLFF